VRASIMRDWDDHRYALGFTFGRCWWGISRASTVSVGSHGGRRIRWRCGAVRVLPTAPAPRQTPHHACRFLLIGLNERTPDHSTISRLPVQPRRGFLGRRLDARRSLFEVRFDVDQASGLPRAASVH